jgi:hypothetical protein
MVTPKDKSIDILRTNPPIWMDMIIVNLDIVIVYYNCL